MTHHSYTHDPDFHSDFGQRAPLGTPIILVDMDGVLVDLIGWLYRTWAERHPDEPLLPRENLREFYVDIEHPEEYRDRLRSMLREPAAFSEPEPMPGAISGIKRLTAYGEVFICTAPMWSNPTCTTDKVEWVERHLGSAWTKRMIVTKDKTVVRGHWLIDDRPRVDGHLLPTWEHVIFDHPYNRHTDHVLRMYGWEDVNLFVQEKLLPTL